MPVPTIIPPVRVVVTVVVVMTVVTVMAVMAMMAMMAMMPVVAAMTAVMAAAVHHVMPAATTVVAAAVSTVAAALTAGFGTSDGERRQADNDRCGKGEDCSALEHVCGSLVCSAGAHPRSRTHKSLKTPPAAVLAITLLSNPTPHGGAEAGGLRTRPRKTARHLRLQAHAHSALTCWI